MACGLLSLAARMSFIPYRIGCRAQRPLCKSPIWCLITASLFGLTLAAGCGSNDAPGVDPDAGMPEDGDSGSGPEDPALRDDDGDGVPAAEDCDDNNPDISPDAPEVPNGIDDDCDGIIDEITVCAAGQAQFTTIQEAMNAAEAGDTIDVCAGTYKESLVAPKPLTVRGPDGPDVTIVEGSGPEAVLQVHMIAEPGFAIEGISLHSTAAAGNSGGGVRCSDSTLHMSSMVISGHSASDGGGMRAERCALDIKKSVFSNNQALVGGGGGALFVACSGVFAKNIVENNTAAAQGGGLEIHEGMLVLDDNQISGNSAVWSGGGIYLDSDSPVTGNLIAGNRVEDKSGQGGGLFVKEHAPEIANNIIRDNTAINDGGGGFLSLTKATVTGNMFIGNRSVEDDGGGLRVFVSDITMTDNEFMGNSAGDDGGGAKLSHARSYLRGNSFIANSAGESGGGLELDDDVSVVSGGLFRGNKAMLSGGAIHVAEPPGGLRIENVLIEGNSAGNLGGGIHWDRTLKGDRSVLDFAILSGNTAPDGTQLYLDSFPLTVTNSILYNHVTTAAAVTAAGGAPTWAYNNVFPMVAFGGMPNPTGSSGNISANPMFVAPSAGDYSLAPESPCIDAGDPEVTDVDGTRADMGVGGGPEAQ
jgi:hypothetical protein